MSGENNTRILEASRAGDDRATASLLELVYDRLRQIAGSYVKQQAPRQTLQATDIVHGAYLKLIGQQRVDWKDRTHFIAIAACAMRQVMVDYARRKQTQKRGGGRERIPLRDTLAISDRPDIDLLSLDEALSRLGRLHARQARVVELRFFGGLNTEEIAETLKVSSRTVDSDWYVARAWLYRELTGGDEERE